MKRVFLIVLDSVGIGEMPDAADYGDAGSNTIKAASMSPYFSMPNMRKLGFFNIDGVGIGEKETAPAGAVARMTEVSKGKDTTIGHWEIAGVISPKPLPTYPNGFPQEIIEEFSKKTGRGVLCNKPYSGTDVIRDYGEEHLKTGDLIVYTSADSVFQVAAHEDIVPVEKLYEYCQIARDMLRGEHGVGRVIARPFTGTPGNFTRTTRRHDFSLQPPKVTMLDQLSGAGFDVLSVGKIIDIFAEKGITEYVRTTGNEDGINKTLDYMKKDFNGLCFTNLVDYDMLYGHRRNPQGYAQALEYFDSRLPDILPHLREDDVCFITADHGNDPTFKGTDHTREQVPILCFGKNITPQDLGQRETYADLGQTIADYLQIAPLNFGTSFK